jgi:hypothetical protein
MATLTAYGDSITGFTFHLDPGEAPLHNVYVFTWKSTGNFLTSDILVDGGGAVVAPGNYMTPAGFSVPGGDSQFNLSGTSGLFPETTIPDVFVVMGLETDQNNQEHLVLGTNQDLTGVNLFTIFHNFLGAGETDFVDWLKTGFLGAGEETGLVAFFIPRLENLNYGQNLGQSAQLFYFSNGQPLEGATVTANAYGEPYTATAVPVPSAAGLGLFGLCSLMLFKSVQAVWRRRRAV